MSFQKRLISGLLVLICFTIALDGLTTEAFAGIFSVGSKVRTSCVNCGAGTDQVCIAVEDATCETYALMYVKCPTCQNVKTLWNGGPFSGLGHDWQETGRTEPTTEAAGAVTYQCSVCGKSKSEALPKLEPEECTHDWVETDRRGPTETTPGQIIYTCSKCGEVKTEGIPVKPVYDEIFMNWLGSVVRLFNMTLDRILGITALQLYAGVLVFLVMFSLLAKLIQQGRRGRL